ncbi:hypothetical protein BDZ97DRAFT_1926067 [Flammula alnicola]|nr:hypothetical protein BDZ97DRAFT_1926067 [Flammula alnicola]
MRRQCDDADTMDRAVERDGHGGWNGGRSDDGTTPHVCNDTADATGDERIHGCHDEATMDEATMPRVCNTNMDATGDEEQQLLLLSRCHTDTTMHAGVQR